MAPNHATKHQSSMLSDVDLQQFVIHVNFKEKSNSVDNALSM
jgi:hypothetical protein